MCEHFKTDAEMAADFERCLQSRNGIGAGREELWLAEEMALHRRLRSRQSPPRCLACGSTKFVEVDVGGSWVPHPAGTGRVRVEDAGLHVDAEGFPTYTVEGVRIEEPRTR